MNRRFVSFLIAAVALSLVTTVTQAQQTQTARKPLQVYILAGQSNMQGHAHVRTLGAMALDPTTAEILKELQNADGSPRISDQVWISSLGTADKERTGKLTTGFGAEQGGPKIGPELTFGIYLQKSLKEPILIIKTAWGGKSLHTDFRPPSAGPYRLSQTQLDALKKQGKDIDAISTERAQASGQYYRLMLEHVQHVLADIKRVYPDYDAQQGHELAGFVWFQGWNDMVSSDVYPQRDKAGGYDIYSELLAQFIRDVRKDLKAPELPFVIGVMGVGGPTGKYGADQLRYQSTHQNFRDAMAAPSKLPEFKGNVAAVLTENYWDMEVTALRTKERTLKPKLDELNAMVKAGKLSRDEAKQAGEKLYAATFTPQELKLLRESVSNAEFHYLGSARIMSQIGKGFAEAMLQLQNQ